MQRLRVVVTCIFATTTCINSAAGVSWAPCASLPLAPATLECAAITVPLCYDGANCGGNDASPFELPMVRLQSAQPDATPTIWWLADDRDLATLTLDIVSLQASQNASVYVLQRRGVAPNAGPDTVPECAPLQLQLPRLLSQSIITKEVAEAVSTCSARLTQLYGGTSVAALSTDNAAKDLVNAIATVHDGDSRSRVVVFARSRAALVVRRLMQMESAQSRVAGYVLEALRPPLVSDEDAGYADLSDAFLDACDRDATCGKYLPRPQDRLRAIYKEIDTASGDKSKCTKLLHQRLTADGDTSAIASYALRTMLGKMLLDTVLAPLTPALIYRVHHCSRKDQAALTQFLNATESLRGPQAPLSLLDLMVDFSERWNVSTSTSKSSLQRDYGQVLMGGGGVLTTSAAYCALSGNTTTTLCSSVWEADARPKGMALSPSLLYKPVNPSNKGAVNLLLLVSRTDPLSPTRFINKLYTQLTTINVTQLVLVSDSVGSPQHFGGVSQSSNRTRRAMALFIATTVNASTTEKLRGVWHMDQVETLLNAPRKASVRPPASSLEAKPVVDFTVGWNTSRTYFGSVGPFGDDEGILQPFIDAGDEIVFLFHTHLWASVAVTASSTLVLGICCFCCCRGWCRRHADKFRELRRKAKQRQERGWCRRRADKLQEWRRTRQERKRLEEEEAAADASDMEGGETSPLAYIPDSYVAGPATRHVRFDHNATSAPSSASPPRIASGRRRRYMNRMLWHERAFIAVNHGQQQQPRLSEPSSSTVLAEVT